MSIQFVSNNPRVNSKCIALYNRIFDDGRIVIHNSPYSFNVTGRYGIIGCWKPISFSIDIFKLKILHVNIFVDEKHYVFSDGLFLFWFVTDTLNKFIRVVGSEKSDYEVWEVNQLAFTEGKVREHNHNVRLFNSEKNKQFCEELIEQIVAQ